MAKTKPPSGTIAALGGTVDEALSELRVPAYVLDSNGTIRWMNKRALDLLGDLQGQNFAAAVMPETLDAARLAFARKLVGTEEAADYSALLRSPRGSFRGEISSVALHGNDRVVGVFGLIQIDDIAKPPRAARAAHLTPRQREVLGHLAEGYSTDQITAELGLSRETVRNHIRGVFAALGVHSRLEAVAKARKEGLLDD
jgi:DNA-binding CsgD family transcriptional regulator